MKIIFLKKSISSVKLWLDDERDPTNIFIKENFGSSGDEVWVKTVEEAKDIISKGNVSSISFDNDLGEGNTEGRELAKWIEEEAYFKRIPKLQWRVHSMNNVAGPEILRAMNNADRFWNE
jgi:hypothetical protein